MRWPGDDTTRFFDKIKMCLGNGCWIWTGSICRKGYGRVRRDGKLKGAHRVMYELLLGPIPEGKQIDHICQNKGCVRPSHLRACSNSENKINSPKRTDNKSGYKGVCFNKPWGKWQAAISINGKHTHLGGFPTPELAYAAYCEAAKKYHGEFANFG